MAGERQLIVKIVGDDKSLQAAFARSTASTKAFAASTSKTLSGGVSVGKQFDPLLARVKESKARAEDLSKQLAALDDAAAGAGVGTGKLTDGLGGIVVKGGLATLAITSAYTASRRLSDALEQTGESAFTASGKISNFGSALLSGDIVGAFQALNAQAKTLDEAGISAEEATGHYAAFKAVISSGFEGPFKSIAEQAVKLADGMRASQAAADALADSTARLGTVFRDSTGQAVAFKGAIDDLGGPRGPGLVDQINAALEQEAGGKFGRPAGRPIGPSARNAAAQTIAQANSDLDELLRLQKIEQSRAAKAVDNSHGNVKQRTRLNQNLAAATASVITTERAIKAQAEAAAKAAEAARKAKLKEHWEHVIAALDLGVSSSELTPRLSDDLAALNKLKAGLEAQIKVGHEVDRAQARLVGVVGEIADKQEEIRRKAAEAVQRQQFRALGLGVTGEEIVPGAENLAKRFESLSDRLSESGAEIGPKLAARFRLAGKEIQKEGKNLTKTTRETIDGILKEVSGKLDNAFHTPTRAINRNAFLEGLGVDPETEALIKRRLQGFNTAGRALAPPRGAFGAFGIPFGAGGQPINVTTTVVLDGQAVGRSVTKHQQNAKRSNPAQKRGPHAGI